MFGISFKNPCKNASLLEEVAIKVSELYTDPGKVFIGKSDFYDSCKYNTDYLITDFEQ